MPAPPDHLLTPTAAHIDLGRVRHNARQLQARAGAARLMAVVKADAYGHGAVPVVRALQADGVDFFAVATVPEAVQLREAGIEDRILVFAAPLPDFLPAYVRHDLDVTVSSEAVAEAVGRVAREAGPLRAHLKIDTGMHRIGVAPDEAARVVRMLDDAPGVTLEGLWTHFATSDSDIGFAETQWARFAETIAPFQDRARFIHAANTGALFNVAPSIDAARALVRTGISLYGYPDAFARQADLRPAMRFTSRVVHRQIVAPGESVSYDCTWTARRPTLVATVGAGYGDGYPRLASNRAEVGVSGRRARVLGTVCMDMLMIDLGDPEGEGRHVAVGDEVVLFGDGGPTADDLARWTETIPYEITCRVGARVPRRYTGGV